MSRGTRTILIVAANVVLLLTPAGGVLTAGGNELGPRLREIDSQRRFGRTPEQMEKMETQYLELLQEYDSPEDKGRIYAAIANSYINSGIQTPGGLPVFPEKVAEYCEKALQYPQEVPDSCRFYSFWGAALQAQCYKSGEEDFSVARREIVIPYLKTLKFVFDNLTSRESQNLPSVVAYDVPPSDPHYGEIVRKHNRQMNKWKEVKLNNKLLRYKDVLVPKVVSLYSQKPYATDELRELAGEILKKEDTVKELISLVTNKIKDKDPDYVEPRPSTEQPEKEPRKEEQPISGKVPKPETVKTPVPEQLESAEEGTNWLVVSLAVVAVILAGAVVFLLLRRRG